MSRFTPITVADMDAVLKADKGWLQTLPRGGNEFVYIYHTKHNPDVVVKVYSSVEASGEGRGCGGDSIKVCAVNVRLDRGLMKTSRIHRTEGWQERLVARVIEVIKELAKR